MAWATSNRLERLPDNWPQLRREVLARDRYTCQARGCSERATDVDHIDRHGGDGKANLQSLCQYHHNKKSSAEGHAEAARIRKLLKHPGEKTPGRVHPRDAKPRKYKGF